MFKFWLIIICWAVISTIIVAHHDALSEHENILSLLKYHYRTKHHHSLHRSHSSRGHHYPPELKKLFEGKKKEEKTVCQSEECKLIARIIKDNINKSVDPCDDFYQYACGKFGENNPIPPGEDSWSFVQIMKRNLNRQMEEILESKTNSDDLLTIKLGKRYFRTCMDLKGRERKGLEPLVITMARIGGWPLIMEPEEWDETEHTWQKIDDYYAALTGYNTFYNLRVYTHISSSTNETLTAVTLPRVPTGSKRLRVKNEESKYACGKDSKDESKEESYDDKDTSSYEGKEEKENLNDNDDDSQQQDSQEKNSKDTESEEVNSEENRNMTQEYVNTMIEIAMAIAETRGFQVSENRIAADVNDVVQFQRTLIEIGDNTYMCGEKQFTLEEFQELYDNTSVSTRTAKINFIDKILNLLEVANVKASQDLEIHVQSTRFFLALNSLLDETPDRVIINYIHWLYVSHLIDATTEKMEDLHYVLQTGKKLDKITSSKKNRMEKCVGEVGLIDITAYAFVKKYFPDKIKKTAEEMISYVQKEVEREILESEWLDDNIRKFATEKVQNMKKFVGYPSWYSNTTIMKNFYKGLVIGPSYFENRMSFGRYETWKNFRLLKKDPTSVSEEDYITPLILNALYAPFENKMFITAADFQNPFFAISRPPIINYGIIGAIMGHEINHGFDDSGRLYNKNGKEIQWLGTMASAYNKRVECFVDQYNSLVKDEELKKNEKDIPSYGNRTRNENIADTMGLEASLGAYRIYEKEMKSKSEEVLSGLEHLTTEQLYFLSYANTFCEVISPERLKEYKDDEHSTGQLRVLGPISNSESFAKSFNCPIGSPMNPEKKCNIWK
ncbi:PREDICTED: neprilysin-1-like [Polistes canadensis]|uniref:neprilysin-1-like n=1 Tax=Polistes canadensis TaxID=91411 RepID=UPI000718B550|nr:PREDICTED: neprilysin-1-like [Polistes canadensis]